MSYNNYSGKKENQKREGGTHVTEHYKMNSKSRLCTVIINYNYDKTITESSFFPWNRNNHTIWGP